MKQYGLIGKQLSHSFSKLYFDKKIKEECIQDVSYHLFPMDSLEEFHAFIQKNKNIQGLNVTIPYKTEIIKYLDKIDAVAKKINAVNVIQILRKKNTYVCYGYNTDAIGFENVLKKYDASFLKSAIVLGTGGAAKAVAYVLQQRNIPFRFVSRQPTNNNSLSYCSLNQDMIFKTTLIINCTPLGMYPSIDTFPEIPYHAINNQHLLIDLVYNPIETLFLKKGKTQGATIENGYQMLCFQAEAAWKIWNADNITL
ncbi:MAG: shikimate dehydrogenase [Bacteroidales bacterium]|nr:shikimate dehydrogenase [Bacteroidales bacterium]